MKTLCSSFLLLLLITLTGLLNGCGHPKAAQAAAPADSDILYYTCVMHPQVHESKPGKCPICGMELIPVRKEAAPGKAMEMKPGAKMETGEATVHLDAPSQAVASIRTEVAGPATLWKSISVFGDIEPVENGLVTYTWYYGGRVQKVLIDFNTAEVRKGQGVLEVFSEEALTDQEAYLSMLRERWLSTFYERDLMNSRIAAVVDRLKNIGFDSSSLKALADKHETRSTFTLDSPVSGTLLTPPPTIGTRFDRQTVLFRVGKIDKVWLSATVYEKDIPALSIGQEAEVQSPSVPGKNYMGKLVYIGRQLDPTTRAVQARFEVENPGHALLPSASATAFIKKKIEGAITLPSSAVIDTGKRKIAWIKTDDGHYQQHDLDLGEEAETEQGEKRVVVLEGLKAGDEVVTDGAFLIDAEAQLSGSDGHQH